MFLRRALSVSLIAMMALTMGGFSKVQGANGLRLRGVVESNGVGLDGYAVSLYASFVTHPKRTKLLASAATDSSGQYEIDYRIPSGRPAVLYILATRGQAMLASAIGDGPVTGVAFVNERTTIATGFAFAQFVSGQELTGNRYGMLNAVHMAANMANPQTGKIADVLALPPNGPETEALATFNSLADIVAYCLQTAVGCDDLFDEATVPGGARPHNVLQAVANIAKYPWSSVNGLFNLSTENQVYIPALTAPPDAWTLFLKFTGTFSSQQDATNLLNGPGTFAIDKKGFLWVNDNYTPAKPLDSACPGERLLKFYPSGENFTGSPYFGGGLSGSGFGISIAPNNRVWVGNFGFNGVGCPITPNANSVSLFRPNGTPISPDVTGYTAGPISWPMATVPDRKGNIWIADCGSDSVTVYPKGKRSEAFEVPFPTNQPSSTSTPVAKPFGIAIDSKGHAWVTGTLNSTMAVYGRKGKLIRLIPSVNTNDQRQLSRPVGVASDIEGNIWVANSDWLDPTCPPGKPNLGPGTAPTVALFRNSSANPSYSGTAFTGGGLIAPWGIAVDGNDTVWAANFGFPFDLSDPSTVLWPAPNRVSNFCGVDTSKCPPTKQSVGKAISPDGTGYTSTSLDRNTGIAIDPSGNVWLANNWKQVPLVNNPGGNAIVVLVGAAAPLKTPLIGTPQPFAGHTAN
jgi:hypothetical protein